MQVKVINKSINNLPEYGSVGAAGLDLRADIIDPVVLKPFERKLIPTGLYMEIPTGYEVQIRPRSGLAVKHGITVLNTPGTVDSDYVGEICVCLINLSNEDFVVNPGDRIAQMVLAKHEVVEWEVVDALSETERGEGGFGSTGVK